jgi:tyrosinase
VSITTYLTLPTGIHGLPKSPWDGVEVQTKEPGDRQQSGYCTHGSILFPTWHRPYLAMIEVSLGYSNLDLHPLTNGSKRSTAECWTWRTILVRKRTGTDKQQQKFRLPYFDYYRPRSHTTTTFPGITEGQTTSFPYDFSLPQIFTLEKVMLMKPGATALSLEDNPLNYFNFPSSGMIPISEWDAVVPQASGYSRIRTTRYPRSQSDLEGDPVAMNAATNRNRESGTGQILNMITDPAYNMWDAFSTDEAGLTPASGSLEDIHGNYHVIIGNTPGHMSQVAVAAFDPVFWFHH